jgi:hypothetical protein
VAALHGASVRAVRLAEAVASREDGESLAAELRRLLGHHRDAGSALAARLLEAGASLDGDVWLVEPVPVAAPAAVPAADAAVARPAPDAVAPAGAQPNRNRAVA